MKKIIKFLSIMSILLFAGCTSDKEVITHCKLNSKNAAQGYELETDYEIHSKDGIVSNVVTKEVFTSNSEQILEYMKKYISTTYASTNKVYGGYDNKVTVEDDKLTSITNIDYTKMNLKKYVEDNTIMKSYVNSKNELTLDGSKKIYEALGAECK